MLRGGSRSSNLELYRIFCMILIVAHHLVVTSGLAEGPMMENPTSIKTLSLWALGMWGKTGINCFLMITGYFMCQSQITFRKFLKLTLEIYFYNLLFFVVFLIIGQENIEPSRLISVFMPVWGIHGNFLSCFLCFWLTIPFWNILIRNMSQKQHLLLLVLLLSLYTIGGSIYSFRVDFNYVTWFGIIYLIASYIRLYPHPIFERKRLWMFLTVGGILLALMSMIALQLLFGGSSGQFFVYDCNKVFAVSIAVTSFIWFKNIKLPYNRFINIVGGSTFGVFLIHTNSNAVRKCLWNDTLDCIGHYSIPTMYLIMYFLVAILIIFLTCVVIDIFRIRLVEEPFFKWYDKKDFKYPRIRWMIEAVLNKLIA